MCFHYQPLQFNTCDTSSRHWPSYWEANLNLGIFLINFQFEFGEIEVEEEGLRWGGGGRGVSETADGRFDWNITKKAK